MRKYLIISLLILTGFGLSAQESGSQTFRITKNLSIYNSVLRELDMHYVDTLNHDELVKSSLDYLLSKLDPYTVYIPEEESDDLTFMTSGEYAGIGAIISKSGDRIVVAEPYEGKPAQKNGVKAGDILIQIDGKDTRGMSTKEASDLLKGTPNTEIKLRIDRPGTSKKLEIKFMREKIQMDPIGYYSMLNDSTGYILLNEFTEHAADSFKAAMDELNVSNKMKALVIDLRNNGGGLIDQAVKIMGNFVPKGTTIVQTRGKNKMSQSSYATTTTPDYPTLKLFVLVNSSTASASEILSGSIQDLDRGVIIGERTYGKGLVQNIRAVSFGGHVKITTAKYYIPSGRCIQALDYSHRRDDGSVAHMPDSLTTEFKTQGGRKVRDGGGILPDTLIKDSRKVNIAYYLYMQNLYFDFATQFALTHDTIADPSGFEISKDVFDDFVNYLKSKDFKYETQTAKNLKELKEIAAEEGLDEFAKEEFTTLENKLVPDIETNLNLNKKDISELLAYEIIKRYYFQKGVVKFSLKNDKDLKLALELLEQGKYRNILGS